MKTITIRDIKNLNPCYCPSKYLSRGWKGTLIDILELDYCSAGDRIWVVTRLMSRNLVEIFAIDCALSVAANDAFYSVNAAAFSAVAANDATRAAGYAGVAANEAITASANAAVYSVNVTAAANIANAKDAANQERESQIDALIMLLEGA